MGRKDKNLMIKIKRSNDRYVPKKTCKYIIDSFKKNELENVKGVKYCKPILDLSKSSFPFRFYYEIYLNFS